MSNAIKLGQWILAQTPYRREAMTHLKLQKLAFYCYGAALAFGCEDAVSDDIAFEAWEHGPVCRELWLQHRDQGATPIPFLPPEAAPSYAPEAARHMTDALVVYSPLSAWSLRQESHTEAPWIEAHNRRPATISTDVLRAHFEKKFAGREVKLPEYLGHTSSAALDGIPSHGYGSLRELALVVLRVASNR